MDKILRSILGTTLMAGAATLGAVVAFAWSPESARTGTHSANRQKIYPANRNPKVIGKLPQRQKLAGGVPATGTADSNKLKKGRNTTGTKGTPNGVHPTQNLAGGKGGKGTPRQGTNTK